MTNLPLIACFDRQTKFWGLLILADGRTWDVGGNTKQEMKKEAYHIAKSIGATIETFNWELPE